MIPAPIRRSVAACAIAVLAACDEPPESTAPPSFVGGAVCAGCHPAQAERWRGSHHDRAMQVANESTVLGDFDSVGYTHFGVTSSLFERDGGYWVRTDGPDGELREYRIEYTFGVEPLQQYLVRFPGGRLQALPLAWDSRPEKGGGQRWFHLYPDEALEHDDPLHWTGRYQSWNAMCAECHSTNLEKAYDVLGDRYETSWSEIDVSCEACHGPGSAHVEWAAAGAGYEEGAGLLVRFEPRSPFVLEPGEEIARPTEPRAPSAELEVCAPCHSRRSRIAESPAHGGLFLDDYRPVLLDGDLYNADGQIREEVYVYGSFLQSRMYAAGVTCSDCHEPHSLALRAEGNALCAGCHRPEHYDAPAHHFHPVGSAGAKCVACHAPERTYMVVDPRRDHGFRVPRPDLALELDTADACSGCHRERTAEWAAGVVARWYGSEREAAPHFARALDAGRRGRRGAAASLARVADDPEESAIVRASALRLLGSRLEAGSLGTIERGLADPDALVRVAALEASEALPPERRLPLTWLLLGDPVRSVRIEAANVLASVPPALWSAEQREALAGPLAEYRAAQQVNADHPEAHMNLGLLYAKLGQLAEARRAYRSAIRLDRAFAPAYVNLADVDRLERRDDEGERTLRAGLAAAPASAELHHALGLLLVRSRRLPEALAELERAVELSPERPHYAYVYAVGLHDTGESQRAVAVLEAAHERHPGHERLVEALAQLRAAADRP